MKLTEEQRELIALIPKAIRKSKEYTDATKLILGQIDFMHGTDFAEVNGYVFCSDKKMAKETGISDRQVRRVVKILVNEGLITTKRGDRTKEGKVASKYWLTDLYYELANRPKPEKCPPIGGQNEIKEKNVHLDIELEPELDIKNTQCIVHEIEDNFENSMNDMNIDERLVTQDEKDASEILAVSDDFDYTQYNDISEMVQSDAGVNNKYVENKSIYAERNEWITRLFEELDSTLNCLSQCYNKELVAGKYGYCDTLNKLFKAGDSKIDAGWFTEKQINKYNGYINRFNGLTRDRRKRFGIKDKNAESNENNIISDSTSDSVNVGGCAAPNFTEEQYQKALYEVFSKWNRWTYLSQSGYGLYDYRKKVADMLNTDINNINEGRFDMDVRGMFLK